MGGRKGRGREGERERGREEVGGKRKEKGREKKWVYILQRRREEEPSKGKPTFSLVAIIGGLLSSQPFSECPAAPVTTQV